MKNLTIRGYISGDEKKIISLFLKVFRKPMGKTESFKHWNWEYKENPNKQIFIILAFDEKNIVGHYAVIPIRMKIKNEEYLVSLSLDTMTQKEYRGEGIFPILASKLYNELRESGIPLTYGFPNANSIYGFIRKLDWFEISNVPIYVLPLNFIPLINRYLKLKIFSNFIGTILNFIYNLFLKKKKIPINIKIEKIKKFDERFDDLWELVKNEISIGVIRDSKYLNWRYFQKPENDYTIFAIKDKNFLKGYIILKIEEKYDLRIGLIMDILTDPINISYQHILIKCAIFYFKGKNVDLVNVIMFPHCRYYLSIRRNKFIKIFKALYPEDIYFGVRINNNIIDNNFLKDPKNWYITWGDTDVV